MVTEGVFARQHLVDYASQGVDVITLVRLQTLQHLAARVGGCECAEGCRIDAGSAAAGGSRDSKIEQLCLARGHDEHVGGLQVAMDHIVIVGVGQRRAEILNQRPRPIHRHTASKILFE